MGTTLQRLSPDTRDAWETIWQDSVNGVLSNEVIEHTYKQALDGSIHAILAFDGDKVVGLLHYVVHPVAGCIDPVCYMQDLYVSPQNRRKGTARLLIADLKKTAEKNKFDRIYWLLENGNKGAEEFYRDLAVSLDFGLYMIPVTMKDRLSLPNMDL